METLLSWIPGECILILSLCSPLLISWFRFIVLQHDLYYSTVELATGYTLDAALKHDPKFTMQPIGECLGYPVTDLYVETTTNKTFPSPKTKDTISDAGNGTTSGGSTSGNGNGSSSSALVTSAPFISGLLSVVGLLVTLL